jgi:hypothetical protein
MWVADELLVEFDREAAESAGMRFVAQGMSASFD